MKVVVFSGYSGAGKTTLIERLIALLRQSGQRVSVVKHAHHEFDIDHPGKDSWRHRKAGAFEVLVASSRRWALIREHEVVAEPNVHEVLAELSPCDWVIVEGFKQAALPKIEVWRSDTAHPVRYPNDANVRAIATDHPPRLPEATALPVLDIDNAQAVLAFLLNDPTPYEYISPVDAR